MDLVLPLMLTDMDLALLLELTDMDLVLLELIDRAEKEENTTLARHFPYTKCLGRAGLTSAYFKTTFSDISQSVTTFLQSA